MHLLQTIYPFALVSANIGGGWLLYHLFETVFGGLLVVVGFLVILALIGRKISKCRAEIRKSA